MRAFSATPPTLAPLTSDAASLTAHSVGYTTHGKRLLDKVSLNLLPGRVCAVVGPNGAGKTTLLRLLAGEIGPTSGELRLNDLPYARWDLRERARRLAVLPQQSTLTAALTAWEVVLLGRLPHEGRSTRRTDLEIAQASLTMMDAVHLSARLFRSLSGGEKSRVQAARVLAQIWEQPTHGGGRFLLLDEPTAALDYAHQHDLLSRVRQSASEQIGVLMILHDLNLAAQYADDVLVLAKGRAAAAGSPKGVFQEGLLSEIFGMPLMVLSHPRDQHLMIVPATLTH